MEAARFSETLISNHHTTRHNTPENHEFHLHRREDLKSGQEIICPLWSPTIYYRVETARHGTLI